MRRWSMVMVLAALLLTGCQARRDQTVQANVVTGITITLQDGTETLQRRYTSQEKMQAVLYYIRIVSSPFDAPEPPQEGSGQQVTITTFLANKTVKVYDQRGDRYFREDGGPWRSIDREKGQQLFLLLKLLPSDP